MKNIQPYFSHDSNARNSDELIPVRMKFGAEGYGVYFMLLERLREEGNYTSIKDYNTIAFDLRVDTSIIKSVIEDFGLFAFTEDGECFYSEGLNKRMSFMEEKSKKRSEAGRKGAEKRWSQNQNESNAMNEENKNIAKKWQTDSNAIAKPSKKNSKLKNANAIATKKNSNKIKENKNKENKIKTKETAAYSSVDKTKDSKAVSYWLTQVHPAEAPTIMESINFWVEDFGGYDEIVILAIDEMLKNGAKSYNYLDTILKSWETKKLDTPEKVKKHLSGYYNKRKNDNNQKGGSMSDWDELL